MSADTKDPLARLILGWMGLPTGGSGDEADAAGLAKILRDEGYRTPRTITTAEDLVTLHALDVVIYDDAANGGPYTTYVVPDDGTVLDRRPEEFHLYHYTADTYVTADHMPLPLTLIYEAHS